MSSTANVGGLNTWAGIGSVGTTIDMQWTARTDAEKKVNGGFLASDVLKVTDSSPGAAYLLDMSITTSELVSPISKAYILEQNGSQWTLAGKTLFAGSLSDFEALVYANGLSGYVGDYGVDTTTGTSWVVLNSSGTFAVPEPGTLGLLVAGFLSLIAYAWRKRK
jgi:hypothetical protein